MPLYAYKCSCGRREDTLTRTPHRCQCGDTFRRDYSSVQLQPAPAFKPHWNAAVGGWVNNRREFEDALHRSADANAEKTGAEHNYEMRDPGELASMPVKGDTQILENRARAVHDGKLPGTLNV